MTAIHSEAHKSANIGWLRAAVLGANDGLISTSSLVVGVAAAQPDRASVVVAALAGLVAGALSMAAGEYVSVSSQSDTETADMAREKMELATQPERELAELAGIYESRGLSPELAKQVAIELTAFDALGAHSRDELGIFEHTRARPIQAALSSAAAFAVGAALPVLLVFLAPAAILTPLIFGATIAALGGLGMLAAQLGGAARWRGAARVTFWGAIAMVSTALIGKLVGSPV
ncbi:VIT family protein [Gemmatimonas sp.]|uniref:VIT family protein n=1 Tax=Gemmatimonas sp. TaxID=1962908 RepID=UPI0037C0B77A